MTRRTGAFIRISVLLILFVYSAFYDPMPPWWWAAMAAVAIWTAADYLILGFEDSDKEDDQ